MRRESAYRNDPLADVAIALDSFGRTPELEAIFIEAWFGRRPDGSFAHRLDQVRALMRLYYAGVFLSASVSMSGPLGDRDVSAPLLASFLTEVAEGRVRPGSAEAKHLLGKMYLSSFMSGEVPPGLGAAV